MIEELKWDSDFFKIHAGRFIVAKEEDLNDIVLEQMNHFDFVSIQNVNNNQKNNIIIAKKTNAFLADVNIQFEKEVRIQEINKNCYTCTAAFFGQNYSDSFIIARDGFKYSKFERDQGLLLRGGGRLYEEWLRNSIDSTNKFFMYYYTNQVNGFILYRIEEDKAIIEIALVDPKFQRQGIISKLIRSLEADLYKKGIFKLIVGTQMDNLPAINVYHKLGFSEIKHISVFHLWNI